MKTQKKIISLIFAAGLFSGFSAYADAGGVAGGGGHNIALEFQSAGYRAIQDVQADSEDFPQLKFLDLQKTLDSAQVLVVNNPISTVSQGYVQDSVAFNHHNPDSPRYFISY